MNNFEEFCRYAGLKLNKTKTVVFLVNPKHVHLKDESLGIKYTDKPFKSIAIRFSSALAESALLVTTNKINIIKNILKLRQPQYLSLIGKITVIKSLMIPHLLQLSSVIIKNNKVISELEALFISFVRSNQKHLVSKETLILQCKLGGLKMPSVKYTIEIAKIMWIKRLCSAIPAKWKILSAALLGMT